MRIERLTVQQFRNISRAQLELCPQVNVVYGENGSGKSSTLEAIYYLAHGRSFRSLDHQHIIQHGANDFILQAQLRDAQHVSLNLGLKRQQDASLQMRMQGRDVLRISELAQVLPVQVITPESYVLFFGGPKERRRFLDMGVFHVKHSFHQHWLHFNKALKQRNALLKRKPQDIAQQIKFWDQQFVDSAYRITELRQQFMSLFTTRFQEFIADRALQILQQLAISFDCGWPAEQPLLEVLNQNFEKELRLGYTLKGPHKADLLLRCHQQPVEDFFSRGQLKLALYALKVVQNDIIETVANKPSILLVDDLPSEIDGEIRGKVGYLLAQSRSQLVITAIEKDDLTAVLDGISREVKVFHVKHGQIESE